MIEILGLLYGLGKDLGKYIEWDVEDKLVDRECLELSRFKDHMRIEEYELAWSRLEKVDSRLLSGFEVAFMRLIGTDKLTRRRGPTLPRIAHTAAYFDDNAHSNIVSSCLSHPIPTFQRQKS